MTATNDEDNESMVVSLVLDSNHDVTGLNLVTRTFSGELVKEDNFKAENVDKGFDLYMKDGRKIVRLLAHNFATHQGGEVVLDYLYSGVTGKRKQMELDLSRHGDKWTLTHKGKNAKRVHFVSNKKFVIGTIGVKEIVVK
jgi:hypothetical protein